MAIQPPSDIVLDVLQAADPASIETARARLASAQAVKGAEMLAGTPASFESRLGDAKLGDAGLAARTANIDSTSNHKKSEKIPESYRKFESMVLQNFVKSMLPDSESLFGEGVSGEMWRGMMADQLGDALAKGDGIGIAEMLARGGKTALRDRDGRMTYNDADQRTDVTAKVVVENQMKALDALLPGRTGDKA